MTPSTTPTATANADASTAAPPSLLRDHNIRWLLGGSMVNLIGDQFTLVALPWLVLHLTGDTLALGWVLALLGLPRAVFILLGGAVVDRFRPSG